jgi:biopolymer transport protein ExbB
VEIMRAGGFVMWIILVLSIGAGAVVLERLFFFHRASTDPVLLEERLGKALFEGDRDTASRIVAEGESSLHHLFSAAIAHWQIDAETLKLLLEQEIRRELFRWEKGLALLGTAARLAPLLGLLGTVLGMVEIFRLLPESAASPMITLAGGIWKALLTTVAGLCAAVPMVLAHTYLASRVARAEEMLERGADFILREKLLGRSSGNGPVAKGKP